jgi:hypothetical protein
MAMRANILYINGVASRSANVMCPSVGLFVYVHLHYTPLAVKHAAVIAFFALHHHQVLPERSVSTAYKLKEHADLI